MGFAGEVRIRSDVSRSGLTLVELLIAVAILGALVAIAVPQYVGYRERVETKDAISRIRLLEGLISHDRDEYRSFPNDLTAVTDPIPLDPWGNPYAYLNLQSGLPGVIGKARKNKNLVPLNSDYDLYSKGPDGVSKAPLTAKDSQDDVLRANDGGYVGRGEQY